MDKPLFKVKPIIFTTTSELDREALRGELSLVQSVMGWTEGVVVEEFTVISLVIADKKPRVYLDSEGKVEIVHASFYELYTKTVIEYNRKAYPDHQFVVILHMSEAEKDKLGLSHGHRGSYWLDKNWYMECWVSADLGDNPPAGRTKSIITPEGLKLAITAFQWILLHEIGHAYVHFSGRKVELMNKYGTDPVHYLDYTKKDVSAIYKEVSFKTWVLQAYLIALMKQFIQLFKVNLEVKPPAPHVSRLEEWAKAIEIFEDYVPPGGKYRSGSIAREGSLSYRNQNPGNLRWSPFQAGVRNNFSYFNSYEEGREALLHQLRIAGTGKSSVYLPDMTLLQFFEVYAPSGDNNFPQQYAKFVAGYMGVSIETKIKNLI